MAKSQYHFIGRWRLGESVPLYMQCRNTSTVPTDPSAAPQATVYNASGTAVVTAQKIPPLTVPHDTGAFAYGLHLDSNFSAGNTYVAYITATVGGSTTFAVNVFQVLAGGDDQGAYTSIFYYQTPTAEFIVGTTEDGTRDIRRTPYLS